MNKRRELPYFSIAGVYGGNQDWMRDWWMYVGGCGALTFCDFLIYCALRKGKTNYYPGDVKNLNRSDYRKFGMEMKPYLKPRFSGIKDIETFIEGANWYLEEHNIDDISISGIHGEETLAVAKSELMMRIDNGTPVAYLNLRHKDKKFHDFEWHWFIINGYEKRDDKLFIKGATYGVAVWLCMDELWDTGYEDKGGLVFFDLKEA